MVFPSAPINDDPTIIVSGGTQFAWGLGVPFHGTPNFPSTSNHWFSLGEYNSLRPLRPLMDGSGASVDAQVPQTQAEKAYLILHPPFDTTPAPVVIDPTDIATYTNISVNGVSKVFYISPSDYATLSASPNYKFVIDGRGNYGKVQNTLQDITDFISSNDINSSSAASLVPIESNISSSISPVMPSVTLTDQQPSPLPVQNMGGSFNLNSIFSSSGILVLIAVVVLLFILRPKQDKRIIYAN